MGRRKPRPDTRLLRLLGLLYEMSEADEAELARQLEGDMKRAYRETMTEQAQRLGFARAQGRDPRLDDLAHLRAAAQDAARSIRQTWNAEVGGEMARLFEDNRRGNRQYYYKNLEAWAERRAEWKHPQIALETEATAANRAKDSFVANNGLVVLYRFEGPPPRESVCAGLMARGEVEESVKRQNERPHIGCPHEWVVSRVVGGERIEHLFVG